MKKSGSSMQSEPVEAPPWISAQLGCLVSQHSHAILLSGPSGLGQYSLALSLATSFLCEDLGEEGACGRCSSCHSVAVKSHADLFVLMPEITLNHFSWPLSEKVQSDLDEKKRKPSKEIRVDAMHDAIEFSQRTSSRGKSKIVLIYPAERMNQITSNALLKTLEEPPGAVRFILVTEAEHLLLPTIKSRCITHKLIWPSKLDALDWLSKKSLPENEASALLQASGGRPNNALSLFDNGINADIWSRVPHALINGDSTIFKDWTPSELVDVLQKVCHDVLVLSYGGEPIFFSASVLPTQINVNAVTRWSRKLFQARKTVEHPFSQGLMFDALTSQAQIALATHKY